MTTLSTLRAAVDSWLARDDVGVSNADFPTIMLLAESDITRDVLVLVADLTTTLSITDRSVDLPADFLSMRTPFIDDNVRDTKYMTPDVIRQSRSWKDGRVGAFFTIESKGDGAGLQMTIAGPASATAPLDYTINYRARFAPLVDGADTNWLLQNHFDLYLYATLRAASEWIGETMLEDRYEAKYKARVEKQNKHENRKRFGSVAKVKYNSPRVVV